MAQIQVLQIGGELKGYRATKKGVVRKIKACEHG